jgi:ATP-dependent Clp protease ATP-binding subunit ClpC
MSGRHHGQSATMLDQIVPAIAAGRLVVFGETTPKGLARLMQIRPSLRGVFETITIEPLPANETLALAEDVVAGMAKTTSLHFAPESAQVALDEAGQYLSGSGMPGSALLMLKLTALRATDAEGSIGPRHILQTLSQLSGLPVRSSTPGNSSTSNRCAIFLRRASSGRTKPSRRLWAASPC